MAKPAFDPSQPFQAAPDAVDATTKPAFDPSKPFDAVPEAAAPESSLMDKISSLPKDFLDKHPDILKKAKEFTGAIGAGWDLNQGDSLGGLEQAGLNLAYPVVQKLSKLTSNPLPEQSPVDTNAALAAQGATGDIGPTTNGQLYRQGVTETQKDLAANDKDLGAVGTIGGNLAGALSPGGPLSLLTGATRSALGAAGLVGAKTTLAAAKAEGGLAAVGKELLKRGAVDAAVMAPVSAIQGAGDSQGGLIGTDTDQKEQLLKDAAEKGLTGGVVAGGLRMLPLVSQATSSAFNALTPDAIANSPMLSSISKAFNMGTDNIDPSTLKQAGPKAAESIVDMFNNGRKFLGDQMGQAVKAFQDDGKLVNIGQPLSDASQNVVKAVNDNPALVDKYGKSISDIFQPGRIEVTPMEAKQAADDVQDMLKTLGPATDPASIQTKQILGQFRSDVVDSLKKQIPGYEQASDRFGNYMNNTIQNIRRGDVPQDMLRNGFKTPGDNVLFGKTLNTIKDTAGQSNVLDNLQEGLGNVQDQEQQLISAGKLQPDQSVFSKLGSPDEVMSKFTNAQQDVELNKALNSPYKINKGGAVTGGLVGNAVLGPAGAGAGSIIGGVASKGNILKAANSAGKVTSWVKGAADAVVDSAPVKLGNQLYQASNDELGGVITRLRQSDPNSLLADSLEGAIRDGNTTAKNAAIFSIMQNPNMRSKLNGDANGSGSGHR